MTAGETHAVAPDAKGRGPCVACYRPFGRARPSPATSEQDSFPLIDCPPLLVCDQCWYLAGGRRAVARRLAAESGEQTLVFDPTVRKLLDAVDEYDELHPIDRVLIESGVRWAKVRHIVVPARMQLAGDILRRLPPEGSCPAETPTAWMDAVTARILALSGRSPGSVRFVYRGKRRRWWRICKTFADVADRERRPLTWISQEEVAAAVGCSTRTVRRVVAWLQKEGLLWEVVPGCQLPQQAVPDNETPAEAAERCVREIADAAAREARRGRARAELDAVRAGHRGAAAVAAAQLALGLEVDVTLATDEQAGYRPPPCPLVTICPVYELRVPAPVPCPTVLAAAPPTSADTGSSIAILEFGHPPKVSIKDQISRSLQPVDEKGRAPRGSEQKGLCQRDIDTGVRSTEDCLSAAQDAYVVPETIAAGTANHRPAAVDKAKRQPQSQALLAAEWLLGVRLDPRVSSGVPVSWLAAQLRKTHLLDRHHWSWDDLAGLLHGAPDFPHLPRTIRNPRGWICARLATASPALPPSKCTEGSWATFLRDRHPAPPQTRPDATPDEVAAAGRIWAITCDVTVSNCTYCDEDGRRFFGPGRPKVVCFHTPYERW